MADLYVNSISFDLGSGGIANPTQDSGEIWYDNSIERFRYAVDNNPANIRKILNEFDLETTSGDIVAQIPTDFYTQSEIQTISGDIVDQIQTPSGTVGGPLDASRYSLNGTTGSINASPVTLPFNRIDFNPNSLTTNSAGEITINESARLGIFVDVTTDESSGNSRTEFESYLELDTGSGFNQIDGTVRRHYSRLNAQGASSASISYINDFNTNDVIRVRSLRASGSSTGEWLDEGSSITIVNYEGVKGDPGKKGASGEISFAQLEQTSGDIVSQIPDVSNFVTDAELEQTSGELQTQIDTKIDENQHRDLDQLIHNIAETSYEELTYSGSKVDSVIIWTDSGKTTKIRENIYTYSGSKINTEVIKQYDESGILVETLSGEFSYTGSKLDNINWTLI